MLQIDETCDTGPKLKRDTGCSQLPETKPTLTNDFNSSLFFFDRKQEFWARRYWESKT